MSAPTHVRSSDPEPLPFSPVAPDDPILSSLHPAVAAWFRRRFPTGPTEPQRRAWPHIVGGCDVLVASPTGTGKTLTGFLMAIDAAYRAHAEGSWHTDATPAGPGVIYVSPLRALAVDVHENLQLPLAGIAEEAARLGLPAPDLSVAVRTGDTPAAERAAMRRSPPDLLVTTPESLYLLVTAASSRAMLQSAHTVIVDEVHTLARDKRGAHLALTLERLSELVSARGGRLQRIGLSATQRPLEVVAGLLSGSDPSRPPDHHRRLRPPPGPRRGHRAAPKRARGGHQRAPTLRRPGPHRRPRARAPHHPGLRQHPQDGRTGGPPAGPAPRVSRRRRPRRRRRAGGRSRPGGPAGRPGRRRPPGGGPSRQPVERPAPHRRAAPAGRRSPGPGGHGLARAGDRRGPGRAGLPDRLAPGHRHVPAAGGPGQPPAGGHPGRAALPADPRRAGRVHRPAGGSPGRPPRRAGASGGTARRPGPAGGGRGGGGRRVGGRRPLRAGPPGRAVRRAVPGGLRRGGRAGVVGHPAPDGAGGGPTSTTTRSTGGSGPAGGPGWPRSPAAGPSPRPATTGWCSTPTASPWGRCTRTSPWRPPPATSSCWAPTRGGWPRWRPARSGSTTPATCPPPSRSGWARRRPAPPSCPRRWARSGPTSSPCWPPGTGPGPGPRCGPSAGVSVEVADQVVAYLAAGLAALGALPTRDRLVIERVFDESRGHPAHRALPLRGPDQPGLGAGPAQAVLRLVRLRAPSGGRRRHRGAVPRSPAQLPAVPGAQDAEQPHGHRGPDPGRPAPPHAGGPVAVEPEPGPGRAPLPGRPAPAHPPAADGGRRPAGRRRGRPWPPARRTPAPDRCRCPTTCWSARR